MSPERCGAPRVGGAGQQLDLRPAGAQQRHGVGLVEVGAALAAVERAEERRRDRAREPRAATALPGGRRLRARAGEPRALVARQPVAVGGRQRGPRTRRREPALGIAQVARVDAQARRERAVGRGGRGREQRALGPRRLGIDVVGRHGRDAAEVVDAGLEQARELGVREVRRRLHGDVERHQQPRDRDRPEVVVERGLRRPRPSWCRAWRGSSARSPPAGGRGARAARAARAAPRRARAASRRCRSGCRSCTGSRAARRGRSRRAAPRAACRASRSAARRAATGARSPSRA